MGGEEERREGDVVVTPEPAEATLSTAIGGVDVDLSEYFDSRKVGIPRHRFPELRGYVDIWREIGLSKGEAWSLVISVEQWHQARMAFFLAIAVGVVSILVAIAVRLSCPPPGLLGR